MEEHAKKKWRLELGLSTGCSYRVMRRFYAVLACVLTGRIFSVSLLLHVCKHAVHSPFSLYIDKVLACETTLYTRKFPYFYCINTGKSFLQEENKTSIAKSRRKASCEDTPY